MEIRLRSSKQPWTCRIALRFETDPEGRPIETVRELAFGEPMQDPAQVEGLLQRAQLAILNQRIAMKDLAYFIKMPNKVVRAAKQGSLPEELNMQQSFSTNLICVEVSGPEITDLAFLDLPVRRVPLRAELGLAV